MPQRVYGVPPEQVCRLEIATKIRIKDGKPELMRVPKVFFIDDHDGKAVGINLFIGKRPQRRLRQFRRRRGDAGMDQAGKARAWRCWSITTTPSANMPMVRRRACRDSKVGTFSEALMGEAQDQEAGRWSA